MTSCHNCSYEERSVLKQVRAALLSPLGYSLYIGQNKAKEIGHNAETVITECRLIILEGRALKKVPCFPETDILYRFDVNFYNCYILRLPQPRLQDLFIIGVSLVLHLDNFYMDHVLYFDKTNALARTAGIHLSLHRPGALPVTGIDGNFLPPGYFTDIKLEITRRTRLGHPYGNCATETVGNMTYTFDYCYSSCIERMVMEACGCEDYSPYTDTNETENYTNLTSCIDIRQGRKEILENWGCLLQERSNAAITCAIRCPMPCQNVQYQTQVRQEYFIQSGKMQISLSF